MTFVHDAVPPPSATIIPPTLVRERSQLYAVHKRNFDELDKLIAQGDLEVMNQHAAVALLRVIGKKFRPLPRSK